MQCPLCELDAPRGEIHRHLADSHPEAVEMWTEAASGKMRYQVGCPLCEEVHEARVKPRSHDPEFLTTFANEIRLVAFDMLLCHLEAEHASAEADRESLPLRTALPSAGPGGGRGRPGADGVPLPPGMDEPVLPPWAVAAERLKVTQHTRSKR
jgi:hypothetical protein